MDDLTRFVDAQTVVTAVESDSSNPQYPPLQVNLQRLPCHVHAGRRSLRVIELPMPKPVLDQGERLPASYEFLHRQPHGADACLRSIARCRRASYSQQCFPSRRVLPLDSTDFIRGLGSFHCPLSRNRGLTIIPVPFESFYPLSSGLLPCTHPMSTWINRPASSTRPHKRRSNINLARWKTSSWRLTLNRMLLKNIRRAPEHFSSPAMGNRARRRICHGQGTAQPRGIPQAELDRPTGTRTAKHGGGRTVWASIWMF